MSPPKIVSVLRPDDLRGVDGLVGRVLAHIHGQIAEAEAAGDSRLAESLLMDINIILELAAGGNMASATIELEHVVTKDIKREIHRLQRSILIFECTHQYGKAARMKRKLWDVLDKAWEERQRGHLRLTPDPDLRS